MKYIIITSINPPTKAVKEYSMREGYSLLVVGDKKSPQLWECQGAEFLSLESQESSGFSIVDVLPINHYARKMIGYLSAMRSGATVIIDTDDDNIPKSNYSFPDFVGNFDRTENSLDFINIYNLFSDQFIWPRGFPLDQIRQNDSDIKLSRGKCEVGIFQGLADGDPDVDAIYRLTLDTNCEFTERDPIVLGRGTITPFNSQNTAFRREVFPLLYLPSTVTFRFTDILRSYVAQPIMWELGYNLGFCSASVVQERNPHDYFLDFVSEIPMYAQTRQALTAVTNSIQSGSNAYEMLYEAYASLLMEEIVTAQELICVKSWISDVRDVVKG